MADNDNILAAANALADEIEAENAALEEKIDDTVERIDKLDSDFRADFKETEEELEDISRQAINENERDIAKSQVLADELLNEEEEEEESEEIAE